MHYVFIALAGIGGIYVGVTLVCFAYILYRLFFNPDG